MNFVPKSEEELKWDLIKTTARAMVNVEVAEYRARRLNEILGEVWPAFSASLNGEVALDVDPMYETWIANALGGRVDETHRIA